MRFVGQASLILLLTITSLYGQEPSSSADNPLATLKDEVKQVLTDAQLPFTDDQEKAIVLMMEDRRQASEELFGKLMDFRAGPMRNEFLTRLQDYLTTPQIGAWSRYQERPRAPEPQQQQTQYVRITNNAFTNVSKAFFFGPAAGGNARGNTTRANLNVFANMTNAFNHANHGTPSGVMTSPNFGFSTSAGEPREIEVGMRFQF